ncbi:Hypothetical predicted protein [Paramuricea clavata]|uniref:Winged helix-turn helix domain-containing protein n=1 Tax=Paramuricea clavata TaxID=317549 RepID=A0A7D9DDI9_PARCT|nr:Hypothetical predicted protein [Paramuricea clavata]
MEMVQQYPENPIAEILDKVYEETGSQYACSTLHYYLKRNGITRKKLTRIAQQRSEDARAEFRASTCLLPPEIFVFLDESGFVSLATFAFFMGNNFNMRLTDILMLS